MAETPFFLEPDFGDDEDDEGMSREEQQEYLYDVIGFLDGASYDQTAHSLFYDAMYNDDLTIEERIDKFDELQDYLYDEYDLYFADVWDWEDFREWYSLQ
jgi:hypothetical protein